MKKAVCICMFILCTFLTACNSAENNNAADISEYEVVRVQADTMKFSALSELEAEADLIVIGTYDNETTQKAEYMYSDVFSKNVPVYGKTLGTIHVDRYIKGNADINEIRVAQSYVKDDEEKKIITYSSLTPMIAESQWLFFLSYDEYTDLYWIVGDACGRYPIPKAELASVCEEASGIIAQYDAAISVNSVDNMTALSEAYSNCKEKISLSEYGVYDVNDIDLRLYCEILEAYDLK